jgi:hypothetical protein
MGKTAGHAAPTRTRCGAAYRRLVYDLARLTTPVDVTPSRVRKRTRVLSDYQYWNATPMQRAASDAVKQQFRAPHLRLR